MDPNDYYPKQNPDREPDYDNSASNSSDQNNRNYDDQNYNHSGYGNSNYDNQNYNYSDFSNPYYNNQNYNYSDSGSSNYNNQNYNNSGSNNYNYNNSGNSNGSQVSDSNGMSAASLVLGIASLVLTCCSGGFGLPLAALGIILALLSRRGRHMNTQAKVGLGLSIGGIALAVVAFALSMIILLGSDMYSTMTDMMNRYDMSTESGMEEFLEDWEDYLYEGTFPEDISQNSLFPENAGPYMEDYDLSTDDFI